MLAEIDDSIRKEDPAVLGRAAHTLKSMLLFFEATTASEDASRLETMGRDRDLAGATAAFTRLSEEVRRLLNEFESLLLTDRS